MEMYFRFFFEYDSTRLYLFTVKKKTKHRKGTSLNRKKTNASSTLMNSKNFKYLIQNMPVCIDAFDEQGNIAFWNRECERVTGFSAKEIVGNSHWLEILYPNVEYRNQLLNQWAKKGNNFRNWDMEIRAKDGRRKTISWSNLSDIYAVSGWQSWAIGIDVTSRVESEKKLQLKNQHFQILLKIQKNLQDAHTPEQIARIVLNHLQELIPVKGSLVIVYDHNKDIAEIIAAKFEHSLFYHADYSIPIKYLLHYDKLKKAKIVYLDDLNIYGPKVKIATLLIKQGMKTGILLPLMNHEKIIGSLSLFSQQKFERSAVLEELLIHVADKLSLALLHHKLIEQFQNKLMELEQQTIDQMAELKRNEHRLRAQYESIPIPTYPWQKSGDDFLLIDYNDMAMASSYGRIGEYLGHKASEIYKDLPEMVNLLNNCYENEISMETKIEAISKEKGQNQYLLIKLAYVAPDFVLMHMEDITEEILTKHKILEMQDRISQQNETIQLLRNDLVLIRQLSFPKVKHYLESMERLRNNLSDYFKQKQSAHLSSLMDALEEESKSLHLFFNYLELYQSLQPELVKIIPIDFAQLVKTILKENENRLKRVQTHVYLETQTVNSDENFLHETLSLLFNFILDHFPNGRKPILRLISATDSEGKITIALKDNGNGFSYPSIQNQNDLFNLEPTEFNDEIFDLMLIQKMIQLLGGQFKIDSTKGESATFSIILPGSNKTNDVPS